MFTMEPPPAQSQSAKLVLEHVSKWFQTIAEGEFVCLVGPSGCG